LSALAQEKGGIDAEMVPIAALKPGDSPRLAGESIGHVQTLANSGSVLPPILVHRPTMLTAMKRTSSWPQWLRTSSST
jgi:hypothetical protein